MKVALNGCGRVGKALLQYWREKENAPEVILIRRSQSQWRDDEGITNEGINDFLGKDYFPEEPLQSIQEIIDTAPIDVWFELTPTRLEDGAKTHEKLSTILRHGISVVLANKSPVYFDYLGLKKIASVNEAKIGLSAVMGASLPSFALGHYGAMGSEIVEIRGILNGTTNYILKKMEEGLSFEESIQKAIEQGIAEPVWSYDIDGFDSGIKMSIIASVFMEKNIPLDFDNVTGIRSVTSEKVQLLKRIGKKMKLVATYKNGVVSVAPEIFGINELFYHVEGANKALHLQTKELSGMTLIGGRSGLAEVAASMHRDLLWVCEKKRIPATFKIA